MSPLEYLKSALKVVRSDCFELAAKHGLFLQEDEAGNIWLGEGDGECYRVNGWCLTHSKIKEIVDKRST